MLIQISIPGSFEADFNSVSGIGKKDFASRWMPGAECLQRCLPTDQPWSGCQETVTEVEMNNNDPCSSNFPRSSVSTFSAVPGNCTPAFVYRRRKSQRNSAATFPAQASTTPAFVYKRRKAQINSDAMCPAPTATTPSFVYHRRKHQRNTADLCSAQRSKNTKISNGCHSVIISGAHSVATKEHIISDVVVGRKSLDMLPVQRSNRAIYSKSESFTRNPGSGCPFPEENLRNCNPGALDTCSIIDCCSSTKSNLDLDSAPLKTDVDDPSECSSSGALADERLQDEISERALCIAVIGSQRLLDKMPLVGVHGSAEDTGLSRDNCCSLFCKVCEHPGEKLKMTDCDNCGDAFHLSCYKPPLEKMPEDDWFSDSCIKKKCKILKEKPISLSLDISSEIDRDGDSTSEDESGPISLMLRDTKPYRTKVRIGEFQAEVADWSGPIFDEVDPVGEPLEISVADSLHGLKDSKSKKTRRISSIGNWLQCQEVIQGIGGADGTICGKWRRAPLFEVQTDNWECFRCILWDPYHADCAVPQELDTDEVIKQLKYMEMLRPQLAAKRHKVDRTKTVNSLCLMEGRIQDVSSEGNKTQTLGIDCLTLTWLGRCLDQVVAPPSTRRESWSYTFVRLID